MRRTMLLLFVVACGGTAPAPQPTTTNSGAFHEPDRRVVRDWAVLSDAVTVDGTTLVHTLDLRADSPPVEQLLVKAIQGAPEIESLQIIYDDNNVEKVQLERVLNAGDGQVIELRGRRAIRQIVIATDPDSHGSFAIYGG